MQTQARGCTGKWRRTLQQQSPEEAGGEARPHYLTDEDTETRKALEKKGAVWSQSWELGTPGHAVARRPFTAVTCF